MSTPSDDDGFYNPLDEKNLALGIADAVVRRPTRLMPPTAFSGPGVYALYYVGRHELYRSLGDLTRPAPDGDGELSSLAVPIYVGKAAAGKGRHGNVDESKVGTLRARIGKHARSIQDAKSTLDVADFRVRYLKVKDIWIPLAEQGLLQRYTPLWNKVLDGFGNNDPGGGRRAQKRSQWDTLHPGRAWAEDLPPNSDSVEIITQRVRLAVDAILAGRPVPESALGANENEDEENV